MEAAAAELPASIKLSRLLLTFVAHYGPQVRSRSAQALLGVAHLLCNRAAGGGACGIAAACYGSNTHVHDQGHTRKAGRAVSEHS